ncbi:hypothetical protein IP86_27540 [Rhodopseudomonas sp. AAP120]|uniref:hypothetical protein n=1 Tax=Rhodopseudomonas sp. AAP120 TaxID=1523430 RepID=UPI0006B92517|nr:hypothetical protein [Rhodopseudomonas sp. AAP120]KPF89198.1 hypothetical protein IP86_27540 [Rhodopseudomonas sp. AAP120]
MAQVSRVFDSPGRAQAALDELKTLGFGNAELLPDRDGRGNTTVRVEPPFGSALRVEQVLGRHARAGAAPSAGRSAPPAKTAGPEAAPTASPATRSTAPETPSKPAASTRNGSHADLRTGPRTLSQWLGIPELIDSDTFFSGFPLLIRPTPKTIVDPAPKRD